MTTENDTSSGSTEAPGVQDEATTLPRHTMYETEYTSPDDLLSTRLEQANSLSVLLFGQGFEAFHCLAADHKENVLWALHSLISDARIAFDRIQRGATTSPSGPPWASFVAAREASHEQ